MNPTLNTFAAMLESPPRWFDPYMSVAQRVVRGTATTCVADALNAVDTNDGAAVRFVDQSQLPLDEPYEGFIRRTGCVPTRDNLHDLFNGLVWLRFPITKHRLNELQAGEIKARGIGGSRGALRDALTVFDENAAVMRAPELLCNALRRRDWKSVFIEQRELWQSTELILFGHALLEKLAQPRKSITAHVWIVESLDDDAVAASLSVERLTAKLFLPLPILGVPGWWRANERASFYDDSAAFRPAR